MAAKPEFVTIHLPHTIGNDVGYFGPGIVSVPYGLAESVAANRGVSVETLIEEAAEKSGVLPVTAPSGNETETNSQPTGNELGESGTGLAGESGSQNGESLLPSDFPGRAILVEAGIDTLEKVVAADDETLLGLNGIGKVLLTRIREAQQ